jgi:signal transduction histidine kinase
LQNAVEDAAQDNFRIGLKLLRASIREARRIAGRLRPLVSDEHGITLGIEYLIHELRSPGGPEIILAATDEMGRFAPELESGIFHILRELLTNACCHSGAAEVRVKVARSKNSLQLEVEDRGVGFDAKKLNGRSFGLQEVQQRARLLGGTVAIDSAPGEGTRIGVHFPVAAMPCPQ